MALSDSRCHIPSWIRTLVCKWQKPSAWVKWKTGIVSYDHVDPKSTSALPAMRPSPSFSTVYVMSYCAHGLLLLGGGKETEVGMGEDGCPQVASGLHLPSLGSLWRDSLKVKVKSLSRVRLFATPWTVAYQAPPSVGFSRQEYWSGLLFPSPGDLPNPGKEPGSPALRADALPSEPPGKTRDSWFSLTLF